MELVTQRLWIFQTGYIFSFYLLSTWERVGRYSIDESNTGIYLEPQFRGQGYALEAGRAILDHLGPNFHTRARTAIWNRPCQRLLTALGFTFKFYGGDDYVSGDWMIYDYNELTV